MMKSILHVSKKIRKRVRIKKNQKRIPQNPKDEVGFWLQTQGYSSGVCYVHHQEEKAGLKCRCWLERVFTDAVVC